MARELVTAHLSGVDKFRKDVLDAIDDVADGLEEGIEELTQGLAAAARRLVPTVSGELRRSIRVDLKDWFGTVKMTAPYAGVYEFKEGPYARNPSDREPHDVDYQAPGRPRPPRALYRPLKTGKGGRMADRVLEDIADAVEREWRG